MTTAAGARASPTLENSTKYRKTPEGEMTTAAGARVSPGGAQYQVPENPRRVK